MTYRAKLQRRAIKNTETKALKKLTPYDIILGPNITEKTYKLQEANNQYFFKVHKDANKNDVKQAIQYIYNVTPIGVNIVNVAFKGRNQRKLVRRAHKKAIVTLNKKDKIELGL
ncbi:MAG TPA: 50S ribosomal protein L23 [Candidatus Absconditabacterales bacterium]|nr:50S ribosomal protein L23 [Candidatus Absconditabacterales bacterium]HRU49984.1 50S ribosomal protein L23 [Candidatus Absconditabacterales bacterium]